jgi:hypothetical protein
MVVPVTSALPPALLVLLVFAGLSVGFVMGRETMPKPSTLRVTAAPSATPGASTPAVPTPTPQLAPSAVANRANCTQIEGTAYRSDNERLWFLANCLPPPAP